MADKKPNLHVAMLPWLAFGHIIPWLELAKHLSNKNIKISFISTPRNLERLPKLPSNTNITFVDFALPQVNGLPETAESTGDVPCHQVELLKIAYDKLEPQLKNFLEASSPDFLLVDFAPYWAPPMATALGVQTIFFSAFIASVLVFIGPSGPYLGDGPDSCIRKSAHEFVVKPKWVPFDSGVFYRFFEIVKILREVGEPNSSGVSDVWRHAMTSRGCCAVFVRSCYEIEERELELLEEIHGLPVIPVGQLPPSRIGCEDSTDTWREAKEWLDGQEKVVYVAFGSEATLNRGELEELALGLELSGFSYFWVLRTQKGELPEGFEERTKERGMIWTSWAPQLNILSHNSVIGMLSHSGWSSVVEVVSFGKPLVLFTINVDQGLNARVLETRNMAYSIPRDEKDGSFTREAVSKSLKLVFVEEGGKIYREKVKEMSGIIGDMERQRKYTDNLVTFLQTHNKKKSSF